jgi:hemoglobin
MASPSAMPTTLAGSSSLKRRGFARPCKSGRAPELCAGSPELAGSTPAIVVGMDERQGRRDIESRADCERLVRAFYGRALEDPIIGFIFVDVAKLDLEAHVPRLTSFWETVLLGAQSYGGGAFRPHAQLHAKVRLRRGHFERWLALWRGTVDELFAGDRAELAKTHALRVAHAFHRRLEQMPTPADAAAGPGGLTVTHHR